MSERPSDHDLEVLRAAVQSYDLPENTVAGLLMALDELREWRAGEHPLCADRRAVSAGDHHERGRRGA
jgi:hypothetical protein